MRWTLLYKLLAFQFLFLQVFGVLTPPTLNDFKPGHIVAVLPRHVTRPVDPNCQWKVTRHPAVVLSGPEGNQGDFKVAVITNQPRGQRQPIEEFHPSTSLSGYVDLRQPMVVSPTYMKPWVDKTTNLAMAPVNQDNLDKLKKAMAPPTRRPNLRGGNVQHRPSNLNVMAAATTGKPPTGPANPHRVHYRPSQVFSAPSPPQEKQKPAIGDYVAVLPAIFHDGQSTRRHPAVVVEHGPSGDTCKIALISHNHSSDRPQQSIKEIDEETKVDGTIDLGPPKTVEFGKLKPWMSMGPAVKPMGETSLKKLKEAMAKVVAGCHITTAPHRAPPGAPTGPSNPRRGPYYHPSNHAGPPQPGPGRGGPLPHCPGQMIPYYAAQYHNSPNPGTQGQHRRA